MNKVYAILKNSYEFDDLGYGDLTPYFLSLSEEECKAEFDKGGVRYNIHPNTVEIKVNIDEYYR